MIHYMSLERGRREEGSGGGGGGGDRGVILAQPDKLPKDLSGVINYHPGKGLGLEYQHPRVPQSPHRGAGCDFIA